MDLESYTAEFYHFLKVTTHDKSNSKAAVRRFIAYLKEKGVREYGEITKEHYAAFQIWVKKTCGLGEITAEENRKKAHRFLAWLSEEKGIATPAVRFRVESYDPEEFRKFHIDEYADYLKACGYPYDTIVSYKYLTKRFVIYLNEQGIGAESEITKAHLNGFRDWSIGKWGICKTTARRDRNAAHRFLVWLSSRQGRTLAAVYKPGRTPEDEARLMDEFPDDFRKYYAAYVEKKEAEKCPKSTLESVERHIRQFFRYLYRERGVQSLSGMKKEDVREYVKYLTELTDKNGKAVYLPASVNRYVTDIRTWVHWLSRKGVCRGLSSAMRSLRRETHLSRNVFTRKEITRLFNVRAKDYNEFMKKTVMVLLYASGIRVGEAVRLKIRDIDFEKREALIYEGKTKKERFAQLGEVAANYLTLYLERVRPYIGYENAKGDDLFISLRAGKRLDRNCINAALAEFCRRAGIKKPVSCHSFRHSFGTHLFENGAGIKQVSELIGHEDISTTQRYTQLNPEYLRKTILKYHPLERDRTKEIPSGEEGSDE